MTPQELRELAGIDTTSPTQQNKEWADKQINQNVPPPVVSPLDNLAMRLNGMITTPGKEQKSEIKKNEPNPDKSLEGLADRLNSLLGSNNFKVERLN